MNVTGDPYAAMPNLGTPIDISSLKLSSRVEGCLRRVGIHTVDDLLDQDEAYLLSIRSFGHESLKEVNQALAEIDRNLSSRSSLISAIAASGGGGGEIRRQTQGAVDELDRMADKIDAMAKHSADISMGLVLASAQLRNRARALREALVEQYLLGDQDSEARESDDA